MTIRGGFRASVLVFLATLSAVPSAVPRAEGERFTAFAVNMGNGDTGNNSNVEIVIERWSTAMDRDALGVVYDEQGMAGALKMLQGRPRIGFIRPVGRLGNDITFARVATHSDGSRRVIIVLARHLSFGEVNRNGPTVGYPFTVVELNLHANGAGDGKMFVGARVKPRKGQDVIEHEDYAGGMVLLKGVKASSE